MIIRSKYLPYANNKNDDSELTNKWGMVEEVICSIQILVTDSEGRMMSIKFLFLDHFDINPVMISLRTWLAQLL